MAMENKKDVKDLLDKNVDHYYAHKKIGHASP